MNRRTFLGIIGGSTAALVVVPALAKRDPLTPAQRALFNATEDELLITGPRGCGKTHGLCAWLMKEHRNQQYRGLLLAATEHFVEHAAETLLKVAAPLGGRTGMFRDAITFPSGARITLGYRQYWNQFAGTRWDRVAIDNLEYTAEEDDYRRYAGLASSTTMKPQVASAISMPIGRAEAWTVRRFIKRTPPLIRNLKNRRWVWTSDTTPLPSMFVARG